MDLTVHSSMQFMRYHNFEIRIRYGSQGSFVAEVLRAPYGRRVTAAFCPPFDRASVPALVGNLERYIRGRAYADRRDLDSVASPESQTTLEALPNEVGEALFRSLISGPVGEVFQQSLAHVRGLGDEEGLRLRLSFDLNDDDVLSLAALPWELLLQPETRDFLSRQRHTVVVRDLPIRRSLRTLRIEPPVRILIVASCPVDLRKLGLAEETTRMKNALK